MASQAHYTSIPTYSTAEQTEPSVGNGPDDMSRQDDALVDSTSDTDPFQISDAKNRSWSSRKSWRVLVTSGALTASVVLAINLATLLVAYGRFHVEDQVATIWTGNCDTAGGIVAGAHIVINILSTLLLAASNTSMQCLGSPNRVEVDTAHSRKRAFAIGIPSFRNVLNVSKPKMLLWFLLAISSLPLHLFWNSTIFQTLATNSYYAMSIAEDFTRGADWTDPSNGTQSWQLDGLWGSITDMQNLAQSSSLQRLDRSDCIKAYAQELIIERRNLLMITNSADVMEGRNASSLIAVYASAFTPNATTASREDYPTWGWMCSSSGQDFCELSDLSLLAKDERRPWIPGYQLMDGVGEQDSCGYFGSGNIACGNQNNSQVLYCLSEQVEGHCKVGLVPAFLIIVCVCNIIKIVAYIGTLRLTSKTKVLVTQGDAIRSFLDIPDIYLQGACLATKADFMDRTESKPWEQITKTRWRVGKSSITTLMSSDASANQPEHGARRSWAAAAGQARWVLTYILLLAFLIATSQLFARVHITVGGRTQSRKESWAIIMSQGLGQPLPSFTMGTGDMPILLAFFAANIPQLVLSYLYLTINILLTTMLGMAEWTSYYIVPVAKGLRVTSPVADSRQTSAYFLTIPLKWAAPSLGFFMLLHWLTSEMVFAARIETYNPNGELNAGTTVTAVYYSPLITVCVLCTCALAMVVLFLVGAFKRFPANVPLAGNCSASIAAACQPLPEENGFRPGLAKEALRWGVVKVPHSNMDVGHATFSDGPVGRLVPGMLYA